MKIRSGFVSNSSSSSFILATTNENIDSVISNLTEEQKKLFTEMRKYISRSKTINAFGKELVVFEICNQHGESVFSEFDTYDEEEGYGECQKLWDEVLRVELTKNKDESFSYTVDM